MKPILLAGHERSLTKVKYNSLGDLLFSISKDNQPSVWFSDNGERLGTFVGHAGTVWDLDISFDSSKMMTGSADNSCRLWNVSNGKCIFKWETKTAVRVVGISMGDQLGFYITDATMGHLSKIFIISLTDFSDQPLQVITISGSKATTGSWVGLNEMIYTGHDDGGITVWDAKTGEKLNYAKEHNGTITDMQFSKDQSHFITSSKDHTAIIWETETLKVLKTFSTERPVNSAAMSPILPHIILGGGQDAMAVTTTSAKQEKFDARFFHKIFEDEIARLKGHFGPINTIAFHPNGMEFASGGEDGYVRIQKFDPEYFKFQLEEEKEE